MSTSEPHDRDDPAVTLQVSGGDKVWEPYRTLPRIGGCDRTLTSGIQH